MNRFFLLHLTCRTLVARARRVAQISQGQHRLASLPALLLAAALLAPATARAQQQQPVDLANPPQAWQSVFTELGSRPRIDSSFTERRFFAFRKFPRTMAGQMVYNREKGMALRYTSPEPHTVFILPDGIRVERADGSTEAVPQTASATTMLAVMPALIQFSPPTLAQLFSANGWMKSDGEWYLHLSPLNRSELAGLDSVRLSGKGGTLQQIVLMRGPKERSEITITGYRFPAADEPDLLNWPKTGEAANMGNAP